LTRSSVNVSDLLNHIKLAWINGVSYDYLNGLIWAGEFAASVSLSHHLRRMYLDYHPSLRMWFEISIPGVGQVDITLSEILPGFKRHDYKNVTKIDRNNLVAIEMKYATGYEGSTHNPGVKKDIEKLEKLVNKPGFNDIVPIVAYIDLSGKTEDDAPSLERILTRVEDSPVGLLYGHPYKREVWDCYNLPS